MMTFSEILARTPELYDGLKIDVGTQNALADWYDTREVCDDDNFVRFFRRKILICQDQYNGLLRIQRTEFDPLVANYVERLIEDAEKNVNKSAGTQTMNRGTTTETTSSRTPNITTTTTGRDGGQDTRTSTDGGTDTRETNGTNSETGHSETERSEEHSSTGNTSGTSKDSNTMAEATKNAPQSISYANASAGNIPGLDWSYMSGQHQTETNSNGETTGTSRDSGNSSGTDTTDNTRENTEKHTEKTTYGKTGTDTTAYGKTSENTTTQTGTDTTETTTRQSGADTNETTSENNGSREGTSKTRETGRSGILPQDALARARDYIKITNAFIWLIGKLDTCFFGIYEI